LFEKVTQRIYSLALSGKGVSQFTLLGDYSGFNIRQHACFACLQGLAEFGLLLESRYPNLAHEIIYVNGNVYQSEIIFPTILNFFQLQTVPRSFVTFLSTIKPIAPPSHKAQLELLHMFGYDKAEWKLYIKKVVDDDQIPTSFGGSRAEV